MFEADGGLLPLGADPRQATIFPDDIVCRRSKPEILGRVCCVPLAELGNEAAGGEAHVFWLTADNSDCMEKVDELQVVDRALLHGDLVSNAEGRIGAHRRPPARPDAVSRARASGDGGAAHRRSGRAHGPPRLPARAQAS